MASSDRIKIIIVENSRSTTGALKSILASAQMLKDEFDFIFVIPSDSANGEIFSQAGFQYFQLPFLEIGRNFTKLLLYFPQLFINSGRLAWIIRTTGANIIHVNDFYNLTGLAARILLPRCKLITHVRMLPASFPQPIYQLWSTLTAFSDCIICVSMAVKEVFANSPKAMLVYDRIPMEEKYPPVSIRPEPIIRLLYLGNYIQGKGQDTALTAFKAAYRKDDRLRLNFHGGDMGLEKNKAFKQRLLDYVRRNDLQPVVTFNGFTSDVERVIKAHDVVLNCSEVESFSMVCFEALCYGVPLIATDCGGPREMIECGVSGLLVPVGDALAVEKAILRLANDVELRRQFSEKGKLLIHRKFDIRDEKQHLGHYYKQLCAGTERFRGESK